MMGEYDAGYEHYIDGLHREIIDYQIEVEQVKGENAKLVMKLNAEHLVRQNVERENAKLRELLVGAFEDMDAWQKVIAGSNEWGYGKGCLDRLCKLRDAMQELGMEVEVR